MASRAAAGCFIDQAITRGPAAFERRFEVGHAIADVVNAGAVPLEEPGDRGAGFAGCEQLDGGLTECERHDVGAVDIFSRPRFDPEHGAIERKSLVEIGNGNSDVGQARVR